MSAGPPRSVPAAFQAAADRHGDRPVLEDRRGTVGFHEMLATAGGVANALVARGVAPGDRVGMWADNSRRWIVADLAIQAARAVDVPRGTDTPDDEVVEIFRHANVSFAFVHDARSAARLEALRPSLPRLRGVAVLDAEAGAGGVPATAETFDALAAEGANGVPFRERAAAIEPEDVATIIYTSGTTGRPKGVVLTHANFLHQLETVPRALDIGPDDVFLSILPPWHIFERTVEYVCLTRGARLVYTDLRRFRDDLAAKSPTFVPSVPRVWEAIHDAVRKSLAEAGPARRALFALARGVGDVRGRALDRARGHVPRMRRRPGADLVARPASFALAGLLALPHVVLRAIVLKRLRALTGGRLRGAVVGGGHLPGHVDRFFRAVGIGVLIGYGLTETSPVVTVRRERRNVLGTIGTPVDGVELEIRDRETGRVLPVGEVGVVFTRGRHVMRAYHEDPELTARVLHPDGWFDTGDLGCLTVDGDLCFRGRQKDTIVLSGGENVEPSRVEEAILASPLVDQAVVLGQDRARLCALVVPKAEAVAAAVGAPKETPLAALVAREDVAALLREEVARRTGRESSLRPFESVARVAALPEAMTPENGLLTATRKARRHVVAERFADRVEDLYR